MVASKREKGESFIEVKGTSLAYFCVACVCVCVWNSDVTRLHQTNKKRKKKDLTSYKTV